MQPGSLSGGETSRGQPAPAWSPRGCPRHSRGSRPHLGTAWWCLPGGDGRRGLRALGREQHSHFSPVHFIFVFSVAVAEDEEGWAGACPWMGKEARGLGPVLTVSAMAFGCLLGRRGDLSRAPCFTKFVWVCVLALSAQKHKKTWWKVKEPPLPPPSVLTNDEDLM